MFKKLIAKIENIQAPLHAWLLGFFGVIFTKIFLENFSMGRFLNLPQNFYSTFVHYPLFYFTVFFILALTLYLVTKERIEKISKFVVFIFLLEWLHPIFDILVHSLTGKIFIQGYLITSPLNLIELYVSFLGPLTKYGATPGMRFQIIVLFALLFAYVRFKTQSIKKSILAVFLVYTFLFIVGSLPTVVFASYQIFTGGPLNVDEMAIVRTLTGIFSRTPLFEGATKMAPSRINFGLSEENWDRFFSWIYILSVSVFMALWLKIWDKEKWKAMIGNARPLWITTYFSFIIIGILISCYLGLSGHFGFGFWISLIVLLIGFVATYLISINLNDFYDVSIDIVSNKNRPLVTGALAPEDISKINLALSVFCFFVAASLGFEAFFLLLVISGISYIYSAYPFRLKRIFILSNLLLGLGITFVVLLGFIVASGLSVIYFPFKFLALLFVVLLAFFGFTKDIKDSEGDKEAAIITLANYFSGKTTLLLMTGLFFAAAILSGIFFHSFLIGGASVFISLVAAKFIFETPFAENKLYILFYLYLLVVALILYFSPHYKQFLQ